MIGFVKRHCYNGARNGAEAKMSVSAVFLDDTNDTSITIVCNLF